MKNEIVLDFVIADFEDITHKQITERLGINPTRIYIKGEKSNPNFSGLAKKNRWLISSGLNKYVSFDDHMNAMLDIIEPKIELFRPFCEKFYCEFACALFLRFDNDESTPSIHLSNRYNKLIRELNIEFDIDLYVLPNEE